MIVTGKTALNRDLILKLAEELKIHLESHKNQRLTLSGLRQMIVAGNKGPTNIAANVTIAEIEEAVKELANEGIVQLMERSQTILVR